MSPSSQIPLRVGIALGAGSAAAMAEIGALEVIARAGIPIHCVAGTSAGAIVGAAFAGGNLSALRAGLEGLSRGRVLRLFDPVWPREGLFQGRRALEFIRPYLGETIEEMKLPYAAIATELRSGDEVLLTRGSVYDAVRASIAIPGIFTPWRVGGRLLVDGGLVNPVPVSAARMLGAEVVIALNVLPLRDPRRPSRSTGDALQRLGSASHELGAEEGPVRDQLGLVEVVWQASRILSSQVATGRLREDRPTYLLQIPVPEVGMFDVHRTRELAEAGRRCAEGALPAIRRALDGALPLRHRVRAWPRRAGALLAWALPGPPLDSLVAVPIKAAEQVNGADERWQTEPTSGAVRPVPCRREEEAKPSRTGGTWRPSAEPSNRSRAATHCSIPSSGSSS